MASFFVSDLEVSFPILVLAVGALKLKETISRDSKKSKKSSLSQPLIEEPINQDNITVAHEYNEPLDESSSEDNQKTKFILFQCKTDDLVSSSVSGVANANEDRDRFILSLAAPFLDSNSDKLFECFGILGKCQEALPSSLVFRKAYAECFELCLQSDYAIENMRLLFQSICQSPQQRNSLVHHCSKYLNSVFCSETRQISASQMNGCCVAFRVMEMHVELDEKASQVKSMTDVLTTIARNSSSVFSWLPASPMFREYAICILEKMKH